MLKYSLITIELSLNEMEKHQSIISQSFNCPGLLGVTGCRVHPGEVAVISTLTPLRSIFGKKPEHLVKTNASTRRT